MHITTRCLPEKLVQRYTELSSCLPSIMAAVQCLIDCFSSGNKLFLCGNGGSAADCEHIVGEMMKSFLLPRPLPGRMAEKLADMYPEDADYLVKNLQCGFPVISLVNQTALITAFSNDVASDLIFAQQIIACGKEGDVLCAISTSGNSRNVIYAVKIARAWGLKVIALTGSSGGELKPLSDVSICVPSMETYKIQEYHLPVYHCLCSSVENEFFGTERP